MFFIFTIANSGFAGTVVGSTGPEPARVSVPEIEFSDSDDLPGIEDVGPSQAVTDPNWFGLPKLNWSELNCCNEELFQRFPAADDDCHEQIRKALLFYFDGSLLNGQQTLAWRKIEEWMKSFHHEEVDALFVLALENGWGYLLSNLLKTFSTLPSMKVLFLALRLGHYPIASQLLFDERFQKLCTSPRTRLTSRDFPFPQLPICCHPYDLDGDYLYSILEEMSNQLIRMNLVSKDEMREILVEFKKKLEPGSGFISPRSLAHLKESLHRRSKSFFQKNAKGKMVVRRSSKSAETSPREEGEL